MKRYVIEPLFLLVLLIGCTGYPENKAKVNVDAPGTNVDVETRKRDSEGGGVKVRAPGVKVDVKKGEGVDVDVKR